MAYLDDVKVGECVVYSLNYKSDYPILVKSLVGNRKETYNCDGNLWKDHKLPSLFWSKPKRKVKKEGWIYIKRI